MYIEMVNNKSQGVIMRDDEKQTIEDALDMLYYVAFHESPVILRAINEIEAELEKVTNYYG